MAVNSSNISNTSNENSTSSSNKRNNSDSFGLPMTSSSGLTETVTTDPAKKLRNLRKKLRDIESLEKKLEEGIISNPEPEQLEKVARKYQVEAEINEMERQLGVN